MSEIAHVKKFGRYDVPQYDSDEIVTRYRIHFENGYGASIIKFNPDTHPFADYLERGWELAVLLDGHLCYTSPLTDDTLRGLSEADVAFLLSQIEVLT